MKKQAMGAFVLWQRAEGALVFIAAMVLFWQVNDGLVWWSALLLFFAPDLSFLAYWLGRKPGAAAYNLVHVYAFGLLLLAVGLVLAMPLAPALGALWLAHSGFDRVLGYGLKSGDSVSDTHLGRIGKHR
jgi:hypothetical protein